MRKITTACTAAVVAVGITSGIAAAEPNAEVAPVNFTATPGANSTVITTDSGSLTADGGVFKVKAANGTVLAGTELSFRVDDFVFPIVADIKDHTATLTPKFDTAHAVYQPVALPFEGQAPWKTEYEREQAAWNRLASTITMGGVIGPAVGGIGGAAVGCILGGIAGATIASAAIIGLFGGFLPAAAIGCLGGIMAIGSLGTIAGALLVTAPVALAAAAQYFTTITAPAPAPAPAK